MSEFNEDRMPALLRPISLDDYDSELSGIDWGHARDRGGVHMKEALFLKDIPLPDTSIVPTTVKGNYPGSMGWFGIRRWFIKRRHCNRVPANAVLIAQTMGQEYWSWDQLKENTTWRAPGVWEPPIPPMSGHTYVDDFIAIITQDTLGDPGVDVETCETGYWQAVFSCNNVGKIYRFNDGEWVEYLAEIAKEIRGKMWREHDAKWQPLNKAKNK